MMARLFPREEDGASNLKPFANALQSWVLYS